MIEAKCRKCGKRQIVPTLFDGLACRFCGTRGRTLYEPARRASASRKPVDLESLPPEGRKLREFLNAMNWSERRMAREIVAGLKRKGEADAHCSGAMVHLLIHGERMARLEMARVIVGIMRRNKHSPAYFHPDAARHGRPLMRRDWWYHKKMKEPS